LPFKGTFANAFHRYSKNGKVKPSREYGIDYEAIFKHIGPCPGKGWEIDHIIPLALFNLDDPEQVKKAFAPENHHGYLNQKTSERASTYLFLQHNCRILPIASCPQRIRN